ncbi:YqjF family protein [Lentibacillus sediminis]|uniref:YqjF family protein n=1 Tax=Lentibacillus sediminis TaxID=1940529 RepID=UPI000C1C1119|nr:DUF2071 domain-containing protein [Lentibacillus sediminis]
MYEDILQSKTHRTSLLPSGPWLMTQKWEHLLFAHYEVNPQVLKPHLPPGLELDTYDGRAWMTVIPFRVSGMRLRGTLHIPYLHTYLELNVRTYVKKNGLSGIYFFSLDADKLPAVLGARVLTLPYFSATMAMSEKAGAYRFISERKHGRNAVIDCKYKPTGESYFPKKDSLASWLLERYWLWTYKRGVLFKGGIHHKQWDVYHTSADISGGNLFPFAPAPDISSSVLLHYAAARRVLFWKVKKEKQ